MTTDLQEKYSSKFAELLSGYSAKCIPINLKYHTGRADIEESFADKYSALTLCYKNDLSLLSACRQSLADHHVSFSPVYADYELKRIVLRNTYVNKCSELVTAHETERAAAYADYKAQLDVLKEEHRMHCESAV